MEINTRQAPIALKEVLGYIAGMNTNRLPAQQQMMTEARQRRAQVLAMHREGKSLKQIGDDLGVTRERARQLLAKALKETSPQ